MWCLFGVVGHTTFALCNIVHLHSWTISNPFQSYNYIQSNSRVYIGSPSKIWLNLSLIRILLMLYCWTYGQKRSKGNILVRMLWLHVCLPWYLLPLLQRFFTHWMVIQVFLPLFRRSRCLGVLDLDILDIFSHLGGATMGMLDIRPPVSDDFEDTLMEVRPTGQHDRSLTYQ